MVDVSATLSASPAAPAAAAYVAFMQRRRFGSLDGLRALSVVAVVWFHTMGQSLSGRLSHAGSEGVTLFFAISGFLITTLLIREQARHGRIDLKAFYVRRSLRIFPLYYSVLLLYVAAVLLFERDSEVGRQFFRNLPYFASYTSNLFVPLDGRVIFYFAWSLAAEEQFYLLWPLLLARLRSIPRALLVVSLVVLAPIVMLEAVLPLLVDSGPTALVERAIYKVPLAIVFGVLLALLLSLRRPFEILWWALAASRWHALAWFGLGLAVVGWLDTPRWVTHGALALVVAACVLRENHILARILEARAIAYIGSISYGVYLLHMLCKNAIVKVLGAAGLVPDAWLVFTGTMALATLVAALSFRYFESYFLGLKRRFLR